MRNVLSAAFIISVVCVSAEAFATEANTTLFPPQNEQAGRGLLYFPEGGDHSLYAVPVQNDPALIKAIQDNTAALLQLAQKSGGSGAKYQFLSTGTIGSYDWRLAALNATTGEMYTGVKCSLSYDGYGWMSANAAAQKAAGGGCLIELP
jgi:hypothetical protein